MVCFASRDRFATVSNDGNTAPKFSETLKGSTRSQRVEREGVLLIWGEGFGVPLLASRVPFG